MPKVPQINKPMPPKRDVTIVCWAPGVTEAEKQHDLAILEEYKQYRIARANKRKVKK